MELLGIGWGRPGLERVGGIVRRRSLEGPPDELWQTDSGELPARTASVRSVAVDEPLIGARAQIVESEVPDCILGVYQRPPWAHVYSYSSEGGVPRASRVGFGGARW